jgi:hypothetical protein
MTTSGAELIAAERQRQIEVEGWTLEHDDIAHDTGALLEAARSYLWVAAPPSLGRPAPPTGWPWDRASWKPSVDPIRNLVKAGALIAAEIDRLQRISNSNPRESTST